MLKLEPLKEWLTLRQESMPVQLIAAPPPPLVALFMRNEQLVELKLLTFCSQIQPPLFARLAVQTLVSI